MLQINNLGGKSEWINETQIIIPLVENEGVSGKELDAISKHSITLNSIEDCDQTLLANANGQAFVIGLDQNIFENYTKSDLLLMSNSDLKFIPAVQDSKLYAAPPVDQSKGAGISWDSNTFEKPLAKDVLHVIQETSKDWQETNKHSEICLHDMGTGVEIDDNNKLNPDFMMESHIVQSKKLKNENGDQYIVGYYPVVETCDAVLVPTSLMAVQEKMVNNEQTEKSVVILKNEINNKNVVQLLGDVSDIQSNKWIKLCSNTEIGDNLDDDKINDNNVRRNEVKVICNENSMLMTKENTNHLNETVIPLINSIGGNMLDTKLKTNCNENDGKYMTKDDNEKLVKNESGTLPEQSLPLKKKAKMKKSSVIGNNNSHNNALKFATVNLNINNKNDKGNVDSNRCLTIGNDLEGNSRSKRRSEGMDCYLKKRKNCIGENEPEIGVVNYGENEIQFKSATELLEHLRNEKYINEAFFNILQKGLQEMNADVLREMYEKRNNASADFSSHLKAFALMIHFKQPTAFNHLSEIFHTGWPSLTVIKDWKRQLNKYRRSKIKK